MRKQFFLAMNELSEDLFFFEDMGAKPENTENQLNETDSAKKTQIGIRLDGPGSKMLADIRNWYSKQKSVEFLGEEGMGPSIASSDTTLARFILDAGIKALYSDVQNDELIVLELSLGFINYSIPVEFLPSSFTINGLIEAVSGNILTNTSISNEGIVLINLLCNETFSDSEMFELEI